MDILFHGHLFLLTVCTVQQAMRLSSSYTSLCNVHMRSLPHEVSFFSVIDIHVLVQCAHEVSLSLMVRSCPRCNTCTVTC